MDKKTSVQRSVLPTNLQASIAEAQEAVLIRGSLRARLVLTGYRTGMSMEPDTCVSNSPLSALTRCQSCKCFDTNQGIRSCAEVGTKEEEADKQVGLQ